MAETKVYYHGETVINEAPGPQPGSSYPHPPPYSSGPPGPAPYGTTVVHATVMPSVVPVMMAQQMGPNPARLTCKSCQYEIVTRVETKATMRTHLFAALLCLIGCWPCVCIPYCMDSCMNTDHYCPNCNSYVGSYLT